MILIIFQIRQKTFFKIVFFYDRFINIRGCCKTKINMQCYESEKLAGYAVDSDFSHTNVAVPALYL